MFQFKKEQSQGHPHYDADRRTNPEDSEGLEIKINDTFSAVICDDAADDNADGDNEVPSMSSSSKKSKKKKKKKKDAGVKTMIVFACTVAAIVIGVVASKAAKRASADLQLAMNQAQANSMASNSKSGKGCKDEFKVCIIDPLFDIYALLQYIIPTNCDDAAWDGPFQVPDDNLPHVESFARYIKKYSRNCTYFWANIFYVTQYVIAVVVNNLCDSIGRALAAGAAVIAPATRALDEMATLLTNFFKELQDVVDSSGRCGGLSTLLGGLFEGDTCIGDLADDIEGLGSVVDTCMETGTGLDISGLKTFLQDSLSNLVDVVSDLFPNPN